jgi:hypothetical protein
MQLSSLVRISTLSPAYNKEQRMSRLGFLLTSATILLIPAIASADEMALDSHIDSVGLFKNGLAVVKRSVQIPGPGLSLRTAAVEQEEKDQPREVTTFGGRNFQLVRVKGELTLGNHRAEPITVVLRRQFTGDLLQADGNPTNVLLADNVYTANRRNELTWTIVLKPGEQQTLTYHYKVLVWI